MDLWPTQGNSQKPTNNVQQLQEQKIKFQLAMLSMLPIIIFKVYVVFDSQNVSFVTRWSPYYQRLSQKKRNKSSKKISKFWALIVYYKTGPLLMRFSHLHPQLHNNKAVMHMTSSLSKASSNQLFWQSL